MKLTSELLRSLIKESIQDRIKMIDEAGEHAKVNRMQEEISQLDQQIDLIKQQAQQEIRSVADGASAEHFMSPEIISDKIDEILAQANQEISELIQNKSQLEEYVTKKGEEFDKVKGNRKEKVKSTIKDGINKDKTAKTVAKTPAKPAVKQPVKKTK